MWQLKNLSIEISNKVIFDSINYLGKENFTFLVGPNGSGKTSLLRAIAKEIDFSGEIIAPHNIVHFPSRLEIYENLSLSDLLCFFEIEKDIFFQSEVFKFLEIQNIKDLRTLEMSSGQLQRLILALHLLLPSDLFLLDEPLNYLETKYHFFLNEYLLKLRKQFIIVCHSLDWILQFPTAEVLCLEQQKILHQGQAKDLIISEDFQKTFDIRTKILDNPISSNKILAMAPRYEAKK